MYFKIALRNIFKNARRSFITISAISVGYMALALFAGYIESTKSALADQAIIGERLGHLTVIKKGYFEEGKLDPQHYVFSVEEIAKIRQLLAADPRIELVSPRLDISGLVSNGNISTIYFAEGVSPKDLIILNGDYDVPGTLDLNNNGKGAFASQLAQLLALKQGDTAAVIATTADGLMNAMDIEIGDVYNTGSSGTNDKFILLPYEFTQQLYDVEGAHRLILKLKDIGDIDEVRTALEQLFSDNKLGLELKNWNELSAFYNQVKNMLEGMFSFLFMLILVVVGMSILNTMSMAVMERTREIGTLRAVGVQRKGIIKLFRYEGLIIAVLGCLLGLVLTGLNTAAAHILEVTYVPPGSSEAVPLTFLHLPENLIFYFVILVSIALFASVMPAKRAAKMNLVDALGYA
jgi:putative ABC transport system permease protein